MVPSPILLLVSSLVLAPVAFSAAIPHQIRSDATSHDQKVSRLTEIHNTIDTPITTKQVRGVQLPGPRIPVVDNGEKRARGVQVPGVQIPGVDIETRGVQVPGIEIPGVDIETRGVQVPGVEIPGVDIETRGVQVPGVEIPEDIETRGVQVPGVQIPGDIEDTQTEGVQIS